MTTVLDNVKKFFPKVTRVMDAKEPILIEVTPKDEASSKKRDYKECAMAIASKRVTQSRRDCHGPLYGLHRDGHNRNPLLFAVERGTRNHFL